MEKTSNLKRPYICLLIAIIFKALVLIFAADIHLMVEYVSYAFDAFVITYFFFEIDKKKKRNGFLRGLGTILSTIIFMAEMFVTNLFIIYLSCEERLGYQKTLMQIYEKDINVYQTTGNTPYHLAAIFMLALCIAAIVINNKDRKEAEKAAQ